MANVKLNPIFEEFSRSIGELTFFMKGGRVFAKRRSSPRDTKTAAQIAVRNSFTEASSDWKRLPYVVKKAWGKAAQNSSGYCAFIGKNSPKHQNGDLLCFSPGLGLDAAPQITASATGTQIVCSFVVPQGCDSMQLSVWYRKRAAAGEKNGEFTLQTSAANAPSPVTIDGCTAGEHYEVYAALSDKEIALSEKVSPSASASIVIQ